MCSADALARGGGACLPPDSFAHRERVPDNAGDGPPAVSIAKKETAPPCAPGREHADAHWSTWDSVRRGLVAGASWRTLGPRLELHDVACLRRARSEGGLAMPVRIEGAPTGYGAVMIIRTRYKMLHSKNVTFCNIW